MVNQIEKLTFPKIGELVYKTVFPSGLTLYLLPKPGFQEKTAILSVEVGGVDSDFTDDENTSQVYQPGLAHFLEHQLFNMPEARDISQDFTKLGAEVNAFTSFTRTSYYFSTVDHLLEGLTLLQELVFTPYFTEKSVTKEKGIIAQEIDMYQDEADYRLYLGLLRNLYPGTHLAEDIAGTRESISAISVEVLDDFYRHFYKAQAMTLVISGDFNQDDIYKTVKEFQDKLTKTVKSKRNREIIFSQQVKKTGTLSMEVSQPKLAVGFKNQPPHPSQILRQKVGLRLLTSLLFGPISSTYQAWYDQGRIDDSFDMEIEVSERFQFLAILMDTREPISMANQVKKVLMNFEKSKDFNAKHLQVLKRECYGDFLKSLDSVEGLASQFLDYLSETGTYFDLPEILEKISLEDLRTLGREFLAGMEMADFRIFPK